MDARVLSGGLAQLARAPALQAGGRRFDSDILHQNARSAFQIIGPVEDRWRSDAEKQMKLFNKQCDLNLSRWQVIRFKSGTLANLQR